MQSPLYPTYLHFFHIISRFGLVMVFSYLLVGWALLPIRFFTARLFPLDMLFGISCTFPPLLIYSLQTTSRCIKRNE